jgi:hypothetical protein
MNLQERTGSSQISHDLRRELVSVSHRKILPEYLISLIWKLRSYLAFANTERCSADRTQGSVGCKSTHLTRSDLCPYLK